MCPRLTPINRSAILAIALLFFSSGLFAQIDLSLTLTQNPTSPKQFTSYSVTATITNDGPKKATGVASKLPRPDGVVFKGGNEFTLSKGKFSPYGNSVWSVGTLQPGQSETLTINYFLKGAKAAPSYAEVIRAKQKDVDSTPGNGNGAVNEDDEASTGTGDGGGSSGKPDLVLTNLTLANGTVSAGQLLNYTFTLANKGTADVSRDFTVQAWLSKDRVISSDDVADGRIVTGNFAAGAVEKGIVGASNTSELAPGDYFLILKADGKNQVAESSERNNKNIVPFTVKGGGSNGGGSDADCNSTKPVKDDVVSFSTAAGGVVTVVYRTSGGGTKSFTVDGPAAVGVNIVTPELFVPQSVARSSTSGEFVITGLFREAGNPGNAQPFVIRTSSNGTVINGFVPEITISDLLGFEFIDFGGSGLSDIFYVGALSSFRSFSVIGINRTGTFLEGGQVGDLTSNRVGGNVVATDGNIIQSRRLTLQIWPRIRKISGTGNGQQLWEVVLGELVFPNPAGVVTGDVGSPIALSDGGAMVAFTATFNNASGQYITRVDGAGNVVFTTEIPVDPQNNLVFTPVFADANNNVVFESASAGANGDPIRFVVSATGALTNCDGDNSGGGGGNSDGVDLELGVKSSQNSPGIYKINAVTYTITNSGSSAASGVKVAVNAPEGVVFAGGNESKTSQGTFSPYGDRVWRVGNLAPGKTATLVVNYFNLTSKGYALFGEVTAAKEKDADSTPNNGNGSSAREDDEAYLQLGGASATAALRISPNPATANDVVDLHFDVTGERELPVLVSDLHGRVVLQQTFVLTPGYSKVQLSLAGLTPGIYLVALPSLTTAPRRLVIR